ncbi:MAG: putative metal-binding motif-containing protein, partial [bacterium]|nr:putative metal-binding motif-containing protein [bacterium]
MHARRVLVITGIAGASMFAGGCTFDASDDSDLQISDDAPASSPVTPDSGPDSGTDAEMIVSCTMSSDCPASQVCRQERCGPECREDFDCCDDPATLCGLVCREEECVEASAETCNGLDDDADGDVDNGFDFARDATNCGACGLRCDDVLAHVRPGGPLCDGGICRLTADACADGFSDMNGADADGCEYACFPTNDGIEEPDGDDNNCDGATDEGFDCTPGEEQVCGAGTGICQEGVQQCGLDGTWGECGDAIGPMPETCNGLDDDCNGFADDGLTLSDEVCDAERTDENCDGEVNEGCTCADGDDRPCGVDPTLHGVGVCRFGAQVCSGGMWTECAGAIAPTDEVCNSLDDNCDGFVPETEKDFDSDGATPCGGDCDDAAPLVNANAIELCDGVDQDCDGDTDEDFSIGEYCTGQGVCAAFLGTWECVDLLAIRCSVDLDGGAFAGSDELPNGLDDDCDGGLDEGFSCIAGDLQPCDVDVSLHGIGICRVGVQACGADGFWSPCVGSVFPAFESCNGLDDDCDGTVATSELDADDDGYAPCAGDCNDGDTSVFPEAAETCNDTDDDCDDDTDEDYFVTVPCDGEGACGLGTYECDGPSAYRCSANPGGSDYPDPAPSEVCDAADNDCDGTTDLDADPDVTDADADNCGACG